MRSASKAESGSGGTRVRGRKVARRISANGSSRSLQAAPSDPSATRTPARRNAGTGQTPEESRMFEEGQCATLLPRSASRDQSAASVCTACATHVRGVSRPSRSSHSMLARPVRPRTRSISPRFSLACVWMTRSCSRGELRRPAKQLLRAADGEPRLHGDPEPAVLAPVPGAAQPLGLGEPLRGGGPQVRRRRLGVVHQDVAARVADARARRGAEERVGMPHRPHVEDGRHAGREALGETGPRGDRHRLRIVRRLAGPHVPLEPRQQLQALRPVAQQRLAEMEVRLHESREDPLAPGVQALDRLARRPRPAAAPPPRRRRGSSAVLSA